MGPGFHVYFSAAGRSEVIPSGGTGGDGCAVVEIPMPKATARVGPEYVTDPGGARVEISKIAALSITKGATKHLDVLLLK